MIVEAVASHSSLHSYVCERIPGDLLGPVEQLSDEKLESLMLWSEEYKAYEKHEIESRFDAVTVENDMKKPTKVKILEMRRQLEAEESAAVPDATTQEAICQDLFSAQSLGQQNKSFPSCPGQTQFNENATEGVCISEFICFPRDRKKSENAESNVGVQQICSPPDTRCEKEK